MSNRYDLKLRTSVAPLKNSIPSHVRGYRRGRGAKEGQAGQCIQLRSIIIFLSPRRTVLVSAAHQFHHFLIARRRHVSGRWKIEIFKSGICVSSLKRKRDANNSDIPVVNYEW